MLFQRIALAIVLLVFITAVFAGTDAEATQILKGYEITLGGKCQFNAQGKLDDNGKIIRNCYMAINPKNQKSFLLLVNDEKNQPHKIIEVEIDTEKERVIWVKGDSS